VALELHPITQKIITELDRSGTQLNLKQIKQIGEILDNNSNTAANVFYTLIVAAVAHHALFYSQLGALTLDNIKKTAVAHNNNLFRGLTVFLKENFQDNSEVDSFLRAISSLIWLSHEEQANAVTLLEMIVQSTAQAQTAPAVNSETFATNTIEQYQYVELIRVYKAQVTKAISKVRDSIYSAQTEFGTFKTTPTTNPNSRLKSLVEIVTQIRLSATSITDLNNLANKVAHEIASVFGEPENMAIFSTHLAKKSALLSQELHTISNNITTILFNLDIVLKQLDTLDFNSEKWINKIDASLNLVLKQLQEKFIDDPNLSLLDDSEEKLSVMVDADLNDVVSTFLKTITAIFADAQNIDIILELSLEPLEIRVNHISMSWILTNLLGNALRHTPLLSKIYLKTRKEYGIAIFEIRDEGEGIREEDLLLIFEDGFSRRKHGEAQGTGKGLAAVKKAVETHQGRIEVVSKVDRGTTFTIYFPLKHIS